MSWLNRIKDELTTLAQEVFIETPDNENDNNSTTPQQQSAEQANKQVEELRISEDDEVKTNTNVVAVELADTSVIDEFFGEDMLLNEFRRENDIIPSSSYQIALPEQDIITCPICQSKMQRKLFGNHLDGCTGIAIRVKPSIKALKNLSTTSRSVKPTTKQKNRNTDNNKDLLRKAGYSENDLLDITSSQEYDDVIHLNESNSSVLSLSSPEEVSDSEKDTRRYRQRNLYKTTRQCPKCGQEIEEEYMNLHLDDCLIK